MKFSESLKLIIEQYQLREGGKRPFTHVIIFKDDDGSIGHYFIYESQIPAVVAHAEWKNPSLMAIHEIGEHIYVYKGVTTCH